MGVKQIWWLIFTAEAPYQFKEMVLEMLENEVIEHWGIEFDYTVNEDNIDDWIDFFWLAIKWKRSEKDDLNNQINLFLKKM